MGLVAVGFSLVFVLIGLVVTAFGGRRCYHAWRIWRNDPIPIGDAARESGPVEFEGTVRALDDKNTFLAPFAGEEAVLLTYDVERKERKNRSNSRGSRTTWKTVDSGEVTRPFVVEDDSGRVRIDPEDATIAPKNEEQKTKTGSSLGDRVRLRMSVLTDEFDLSSILPQATGKTRRFTEGHISPGDQIHVYGAAVEAPASPRAEIDGRARNSPDDAVYRLSAGDEATAVRQKMLSGVGLIGFGLVFGGIGAAVGVGPLLGL